MPEYAYHWPSSNRWGIPDLLAQEFGAEILELPLYPYRSRRRSGIGHFFLMDRKFQVVWRQPRVGLKAVRRFEAVCTPDFSLYRDRPLAEQIHNVYRNRWCGRYWQSQGIQVIPTISWSTAQSFSFCFAGVPTNQVVAIGTPDLRDKTTKRLFIAGLRKMLATLRPSGLIIFGQPAQNLDYSEILPRRLPRAIHPHRWQQLHQRLKNQAEKRRETV